MGKMFGYLWGDLQERTVRDGRYAVNVSLVVIHEFHVVNKCAEAVPSGKGRCVDQHSTQLSLFPDVGVDRAGNLTKVFSGKALFGSTTSTPASFKSSNLIIETLHCAFPLTQG